MNPAVKILLAVGVGLYSALVLHYYFVLVSRAKGDALRFLLWLLCIVFVFGGGIVGCCAIMGALFDTGQKPTPPHDRHMRFFIFITWIGVVWIYLILNWRSINEKLKFKK